MSVDRALLVQYLQQLSDMGVEELFLDGLTAREALDVLAGRAAPAAAPWHSARAPHAAAAPASDASRVEILSAAPSAAPPSSTSLEVLRAQAEGCTRCGLHETRSTVVFGEGDPQARVVVVGEAPGQEEDRSGRPFVGRAGRLLDLLLASVGFPRETVYICNVLKCRPPQNRNPMPDEVAACTSAHLFAQLEAVQPQVVLAVGRFAAQSLLESEENITGLRGRVHRFRDRPLVVTYHPAFLLRSPQMTRVAWEDFQLLRRVLDEQAGI